MVRNSRRGNPKSRRQPARKNLVTSRHMKTVLHGTKLRVRNDPPSVNPCPYMYLVLVFQGKGTKLFTDKSLTDGIQTQIGFTVAANSQVQVKLQKVYVWQEIQRDGKSIPVPLQYPLKCTFYNIFGEGSTSVQGDYGTEVRYSKCGYLWPITDRTAILDSNPLDDSLFRIEPVDTNQGWLCHVHLLWAIHPKKVSPTDTVAGPSDCVYHSSIRNASITREEESSLSSSFSAFSIQETDTQTREVS